jgi:hypothetical protein
MRARASRLALLVFSALLQPAGVFGEPPLDAVSRWSANGDASDSIDDNDGTLENGATFAAGIDGQAFSLDGTNQWVTVPSDASLRPGDGAFTASVWFRRTGEFTYADQSSPVISMVDGDYDNGWGLFSGGSLSPNPGCSVDDASHTVTSAVGNVPVPINTWAHMACVYNAVADTLDLYVNGALEASAAAVEGTINPSADLYIGRYRRFSVQGRDEVFRGLVDDAQYFARNLSGEEVARIFLEFVPLLVGDVDCSKAINATDALKTLKHSVGSPVTQTQPCPRMSDVLASVRWGDVDCGGSVTASDALKVLRVAVGLEITQTEPCADPGEPPL